MYRTDIEGNAKSNIKNMYSSIKANVLQKSEQIQLGQQPGLVAFYDKRPVSSDGLYILSIDKLVSYIIRAYTLTHYLEPRTHTGHKKYSLIIC